MTFSSYLSLARDLAIVAALGYILWFIHHADANAAKLTDLQGVQKQLLANADTLSKWTQEARDAEVKRETDIAGVAALIGSQHAPVRLCSPAKASPSPVSGAAAAAPGVATAGRATDAGLGEDIRPAVNAFEFQYESALASCRSVLGSWPK